MDAALPLSLRPSLLGRFVVLDAEMWGIKTLGEILFTHISIAPFLRPLFCIKVDINS